MKVERVAVIGAGVMGSGIAAHLAGVGVPSYLLDIVPKELTEEDKRKGLTLEHPQVRNKLTFGAIERIVKSRPALIYSPEDASLITPGNMEDNIDWLSDVDWIIEAVTEKLEIKREVFKLVDERRKPDCIVSSNTSGVRLRDLTEGRSNSFREHFLITHFFNPVRYMRLVEFIVGEETLPEVVDTMKEFISTKLGKGVVFGKDTPNFIANRIGIYAMMRTLKALEEGSYEIDEIDEIFGRPLGRPGSAIFGTADLVGIDTFIYVAENVYEGAPDDEEREIFKVPEFVKEMVKKGWIGTKSGQGFYLRRRTNGRQKLVLDPKTMEYKESKKYKYPSLETAKSLEEPADKIKTVVNAKDKAGEITWPIMRDTLLYSIRRVPEIADDIVNIDNAMKWGYGWALGPFETWDAIGVTESIKRMEEEGIKIPDKVRQVVTRGYGRFYLEIEGEKYYFDFKTGTYKPVPTKPPISLYTLRRKGAVIKENASARILNLGDDVICLEFKSRMNAIDEDIIAMMFEALELLEKYSGLVIGNEGENFSVGANIMLILAEAQAKNFKRIEEVVGKFQKANMSLKYAKKPIVAAPFGQTLGGGAEVVMYSHRVRAHAELYMGLVEVGVGLIPGGGGCKEIILRLLGDGAVEPDLIKVLQTAFETIGMAKVSTSAKEARKMGFLRPHDKITFLKENLIYDAKKTVLAMLNEGFTPLEPKEFPVAGRDGIAFLEYALKDFRYRGIITEYDEVIGKKLAYVLSGGDVHKGSKITEEKMNELEREAFVSLCGEEKTQERLRHMLMTGRPLRN